MNKLALNLPINSVSFGQVSTLILRTLHDRELAGKKENELFLFPIGGQADLSSQVVSNEFKIWLQSLVGASFESYDRDIPVFKLWHLNGSLESVSRKQTLLTFYELDSPTKIEINIAKNNNLLLSSKSAVDIFGVFGVKATFIPLAFDSYNFSKLDKKFHDDDRIVFNICGKFERRKQHAKMIQMWIKKYGNNKKYYLQCATYNHFLNEQQNNDLIKQLIGNEKPFNVQFFPNMKENNVYNDFLNSADIVLGMSGGEGWGLPEFHSVGIGKHAVLLNAHGYQTWANSEIATMVNPVGKVSSVDNLFFRQGDTFNQGNIFDWNADEFIVACEETVKKVETKRLNEKGLELQKTYSKEDFVDKIISLSL